MTNYYLKDINNLITQSANFKFDKNCIETEEEIVRDSISGQLYLASDYLTLQTTDTYKAKVKKQEIQAANNIYKQKIDNITNSALIDLLQKTAGEITQTIYDARTIAKAALYIAAKDEFYTTTGLTPPIITT